MSGVITVAVFMQLLPFESWKGEKHGPPPGAAAQALNAPGGDRD